MHGLLSLALTHLTTTVDNTAVHIYMHLDKRGEGDSRFPRHAALVSPRSRLSLCFRQQCRARANAGHTITPTRAAATQSASAITSSNTAQGRCRKRVHEQRLLRKKAWTCLAYISCCVVATTAANTAAANLQDRSPVPLTLRRCKVDSKVERM